MTRHRRFRRFVDRYLVDELPLRHHAALFEHLRACEECRAYYDRSVEALRVLEGQTDYTTGELDRVMTRLLGPAPAEPAPARRWLSWMGSLGAAAAVTSALLLWLRPPADDRSFVARGRDDDTAFGVQAMCGEPLRTADDGCRLDETLTFAYWVDPDLAAQRHVVLFGVDEAGDPLYYAPTPVDAPLLASHGAWEPAQFAVRLAVNHDPGALRIYGLLAPPHVRPTVEQVDEWAAELATATPATPGDTPWFRRISSTAMQATCPGEHACQSVELSIQLKNEASP
ncbi:MAG: hypothetical protein B7733_15410 [Myxococcales bacterium FL481]|nr:MAG: hypothetical protein B7733_15410 [Myxococcales bacterium FL481]